MSKIKRETSINLIKNPNKVPLNENFVKRTTLINSNKILNSGKPREFGKDITNSINDKLTKPNQDSSSSNLQKKYNDMKQVK